jgi:hypothetical protein
LETAFGFIDKVAEIHEFENLMLKVEFKMVKNGLNVATLRP